MQITQPRLNEYFDGNLVYGLFQTLIYLAKVI